MILPALGNGIIHTSLHDDGNLPVIQILLSKSKSLKWLRRQMVQKTETDVIRSTRSIMCLFRWSLKFINIKGTIIVNFLFLVYDMLEFRGIILRRGLLRNCFSQFISYIRWGKFKYLHTLRLNLSLLYYFLPWRLWTLLETLHMSVFDMMPLTKFGQQYRHLDLINRRAISSKIWTWFKLSLLRLIKFPFWFFTVLYCLTAFIVIPGNTFAFVTSCIRLRYGSISCS